MFSVLLFPEPVPGAGVPEISIPASARIRPVCRVPDNMSWR